MTTRKKTAGVKGRKVWHCFSRNTRKNCLISYSEYEKGSFPVRDPGIWLPADAESVAALRETIAGAIIRCIEPRRQIANSSDMIYSYRMPEPKDFYPEADAIIKALGFPKPKDTK